MRALVFSYVGPARSGSTKENTIDHDNKWRQTDATGPGRGCGCRGKGESPGSLYTGSKPRAATVAAALEVCAACSAAELPALS